MKLSIIKILSTAITIPLIISMTTHPASAEQMDRSHSNSFKDVKLNGYLPSVTDLNLSIPIEPEHSSPVSSAVKNSYPAQPFASKHRRQIESKTTRKTLVSKNINRPILAVRAASKVRPNFKDRVAAISPPPLAGNYLRLIKDPNKGNNDVGNPIYTLEAYVSGREYMALDAVSGTASSQGASRNQANSHAPLPDGLYAVSDRITPGTVPGVGRTFIGIYPQFQTGRSDLGIHLNPNFNRPGADGTWGCIGLTTAADRDAINEFVLEYHPHHLVVNITSMN